MDKEYVALHHLKRIADALEQLCLVLPEGISKLMTTQADLDAAIAAQGEQIATLSTAVDTVHTDVTNLLAKVAAGQPVDLTQELTSIQANTAKLSAATASLQAADASANPPAAAPAPVPAAPAPTPAS